VVVSIKDDIPGGVSMFYVKFNVTLKVKKIKAISVTGHGDL
jgi:hypothetical protein